MEQRLDESKYIDLNYEEISPDRSVRDEQFSNGIQNWRFSIAPTGGGCVIPNMSYMLIEYSLGKAVGGAPYAPVEPLEQKQKITLQNNWASCLYTSARFTVAQSEISVVNSSHAQLHTLKQRMNYTTSFIEHLGADLNGFDPDFSRRLARNCSDGVYHRDGLIDCSPYLSPPLSSSADDYVRLFTQAETPLTLVNSGAYYADSIFSTPTANAVVAYGYMSRTIAFAINGGAEVKSGDVDLANAVVSSFQWQLPDFSETPGTPAQNAVVIDGDSILVEDVVKFFVGTFNTPPTAQETAFNALRFRVGDKKIVGTRTVLDVIPIDANGADIKLIPNNLIPIFGIAPALAVSGVVYVERDGYSHHLYNQPDPRSGSVNGAIAYQPPVSFFDIRDPTVFFGDMELQLVPSSNWQQACIESAVPNTYYGQDVKHGVDYSFGIKSVRLYLARARLLSTPPSKALLTIQDYQISNKQLPNGASTVNFNIPPSTNRIICWIQDSAVGTNTKLPLTRFKTRQYTGTSNLANLNKYGPWAKTFDEGLVQLQLNFAGITKNTTNFTSAFTDDSKANVSNTMLQRWIMTNQNNGDRQQSEKYNDWLSLGSYHLFDFTRSADNMGTYLTVNVNYRGAFPTDGQNVGSTNSSTVNLYVCSVYDRDIALTYGQYGNVVSAQTQMR
jgi:hypothetical protein